MAKPYARNATKINTKLDILFSEYIRRRAIINVGGCERCLTPKHDTQKDDGATYPAWKQLQCSHFIGRGRHSTRWDEDNAVGLCGACHIYFTSHPLQHTEWFTAHLSEYEFNLLRARARITEKVDKEAVRLYLQEQIRNLTETP